MKLRQPSSVVAGARRFSSRPASATTISRPPSARRTTAAGSPAPAGSGFRSRPAARAPEPRFPADVRARGDRAEAETRQSNLCISHAARTRVFAADQCLRVERRLYQVEDYIQQVLAFEVQQGTAMRVEKIVAFYTSRDPAVGDTLVRAARSAARHADFAAAFERRAAAWDELWQVCDMRVSADESVQQLLRLHIASTWLSWPERSTSCSGITPAPAS